MLTRRKHNVRDHLETVQITRDVQATQPNVSTTATAAHRVDALANCAIQLQLTVVNSFHLVMQKVFTHLRVCTATVHLIREAQQPHHCDTTSTQSTLNAASAHNRFDIPACSGQLHLCIGRVNGITRAHNLFTARTTRLTATSRISIIQKKVHLLAVFREGTKHSFYKT
jgi:hypothetical protein